MDETQRDDNQKDMYENNKKVMYKMIAWLIGGVISFLLFLFMIWIVVKVVRLAWGGK